MTVEVKTRTFTAAGIMSLSGTERVALIKQRPELKRLIVPALVCPKCKETVSRLNRFLLFDGTIIHLCHDCRRKNWRLLSQLLPDQQSLQFDDPELCFTHCDRMQKYYDERKRNNGTRMSKLSTRHYH